MQSIAFRLCLFFFFADMALFTMLIMPEKGYYQPVPAITISETPYPAAVEVMPTAPSPTFRYRKNDTTHRVAPYH
ncbi:MAG: hypothetical protein RMJ87_07245 [Cytophagales bacterium]|nr:hypothetical protein [Bernardetiaceae bacterium]MDW8204807.1 hypothetical protein [Cytophagales bacterium]